MTTVPWVVLLLGQPSSAERALPAGLLLLPSPGSAPCARQDDTNQTAASHLVRRAQSGDFSRRRAARSALMRLVARMQTERGQSCQRIVAKGGTTTSQGRVPARRASQGGTPISKGWRNAKCARLGYISQVRTRMGAKRLRKVATSPAMKQLCSFRVSPERPKTRKAAQVAVRVKWVHHHD